MIRPPNNQCLVFTGTPSGWRWRIFPDNSGNLIRIQGYDAVPIQADEITPIELVTLVADDLSYAYRFRIDDTNTADPLLKLTEMDACFGRAFTSCFSPNGREWEVTAKSDGIPVFRSIGSDWPRITTTPVLVAPLGVPWRFDVADGGVYSVTPQPLPQLILQAVTLRSTDDTVAYNVTVDDDGLLSVGSALAVTDADVYDVELVSPGGTSYLLQVDANGILQIANDLQEAKDGRDEWAVFANRNGSLVYVVDERFHPPTRRAGITRARRYY